MHTFRRNTHVIRLYTILSILTIVSITNKVLCQNEKIAETELRVEIEAKFDTINAGVNTWSDSSYKTTEPQREKQWFLQMSQRLLWSSDEGLSSGFTLSSGLQTKNDQQLGLGIGQIVHSSSWITYTYPIYIQLNVPIRYKAIETYVQLNGGTQLVFVKQFAIPWFQPEFNISNGWYASFETGMQFRILKEANIRISGGMLWQHYVLKLNYSDNYQERYLYRYYHPFINLAISI